MRTFTRDILPALKCGASRLEKLRQRGLMNYFLISYIVPCGLKICIFYSPIEFTRAPEMASWISFSEIGFFLEEFVRGTTLQ
jgi:hypothetical protein